MELTKQEKNLKNLMGILAIVFLGADLVFLFFGRELFDVLNSISKVIFPNLQPAPYSTEKFWLSLANSMMLMIAYMSFKVWQDVRQNINYVPVILLSKIASSISGLVFFLMEPRLFVHLVVFISDFPIFVIVLLFYSKVKKCK